jgi:hypothetical protein
MGVFVNSDQYQTRNQEKNNHQGLFCTLPSHFSFFHKQVYEDTKMTSPFNVHNQETWTKAKKVKDWIGKNQ